MNYVYEIKRNHHGGYAIYGIIGVRQYYNFTKDEAIERYIAECKEKLKVD